MSASREWGRPTRRGPDRAQRLRERHRLEQPSLFTPPASLSRLEQAFLAFHAAHPEVYQAFTRYCERLRASGWRHYSARTIISVLRFQRDLGGPDVDGFKLNNNHSPYYARLLMRERPVFATFFELRRIEGEAS